MRTLAIGICYFYPEKEYLQNDACIPIQVGYEETHIDMGIQRDNEGDNRGNKHPYYSELSGLYWLWKNVDAEYKGLFHHRRAFTFRKEPMKSKLYFLYRKFRCVLAVLFKNKEFKTLHLVNVTSVEYKKNFNELIEELEQKCIRKYDMIVPTPAEFWPISNQRYFASVIEYHIFDLLKEIIEEYWPEFNEYWKQTIDGRKLYFANISIMRSSIFNSYATFVFGVLDKLEDKLKTENYCVSFTDEKVLSRKFGYVSELLTNTFILYQRYNGLKIKELNIIMNND